MTKQKSLKILEVKLGREKAVGQTYYDGSIQIDPRQSPKERMDTIAHETIHTINPELSEDEVIYLSNVISNTLWKDGYRRIEMEKKITKKAALQI
jgi:hypothetical protein